MTSLNVKEIIRENCYNCLAYLPGDVDSIWALVSDEGIAVQELVTGLNH